MPPFIPNARCFGKFAVLWIGCIAGLDLVATQPVRAAPPAKSRTALVIGNARYEPAIGRLRNTDNDAKAVARMLTGLGFTVMERHNLTRDQLLRSVDDFRKTLPGAEIALFYYAGHGISIGGSNYLIPLKSAFHPENAEDVTLRMLAETQLYNAEQVVAQMSAAGAHCNLVILDACRNTPLARSGTTRGLAEHTGLAEMTPPAGSLIAFATDAGRVAFDGDGTNGLYTEELLRNMRSPGLTIEQVFKRTRAAVLTRSKGGQVPVEYSRLVGDDIYLAGLAAPVAIATAVSTPPPSATPAILPEPAALAKLPAEGKSAECLSGLQALLAARGAGDWARPPLDALLEQVKEDLKEVTAPSTKVLAAVETCTAILPLIPKCLAKDSPLAPALIAKAYNRRGDALLVLGRAEEAIKDFDAALPLAPADAYILYNRGRAYRATGNLEKAKADFTAAADARFDQPKAQKLARQALAELALKSDGPR